MAFFLIFRMSALYKTVKNFGQAPKLLKLTAPAVTNIQNRNLNLLEYQSKGLLQVGRASEGDVLSSHKLLPGFWSDRAEVPSSG